ncbi:MAG: xanthine dehydrogenase family protein subunit M [Acidimicrobiaceae bacterium]|nr:xanthine dehydrogenase family protein subunit M [Acidimicrobiaceae bacterium]MYK73336.1 xanthine dehydrogenase family protein subunit M [Acidimicrobiaceae bacterium]
MKPPRFAYHAPRTLPELLETLNETADEAVVLAGGQSLLPMLNLRLAAPSHVIDLGRVPGLDSIASTNGSVEVGAMVTHYRMETDAVVAASVPLARRAAGYVGYRAIRNRGTVGGSVAHADPAAEWPIVLLALDGEVGLASVRGWRSIAAEDFFESVYTTAKRPDEIVTSLRFSTRCAHRWGFSEFQRRTGDFATVAVAVACVAEAGEICEARVAIAGVADRPVRCREAEAALVGGSATAAADAAEAASDSVDPISDIHGSSAFRKRLVHAETLRAARQAFSANEAGARDG